MTEPKQSRGKTMDECFAEFAARGRAAQAAVDELTSLPPSVISAGPAKRSWSVEHDVAVECVQREFERYIASRDGFPDVPPQTFREWLGLPDGVGRHG